MIDEADTLRAMLGIGPTVLLDIKPPDLLTTGERRQFTERLAEITRQGSIGGRFMVGPLAAGGSRLTQ